MYVAAGWLLMTQQPRLQPIPFVYLLTHMHGLVLHELLHLLLFLIYFTMLFTICLLMLPKRTIKLRRGECCTKVAYFNLYYNDSSNNNMQTLQSM